LQSYAQQVVGELTAFGSNGQIRHLQSANGHADQLLVIACQSPFAALGGAGSSVTGAAVAYAEAIDRHAVSYASRTDALVADSAKRLELVEGRIGASSEEIAKLDGRVATVETTVQAQLSTFNSTFQASESARAAAFDSWLGKFQEKAVSDYGKLTEQNAAGLLAMQSFQDDAEKVLGAVIDTAQAGAYAK
ncbi:hypothetical protein, partial [Ramlibacter alkalitolerans]